MFGCCLNCIRLCGRLEHKIYFQRRLTSAEHERILKGPVTVRCKTCMKILLKEDRDLCCKEESLDLVRDQIRGLCALCRLC